MALLSLVSAVPSALLALLVSRASAWACLQCFTTYAERLHLCRMWARMGGPRVRQCEDAFTAAFKGLSNMEISKDTILPGLGLVRPGDAEGEGEAHTQNACPRWPGRHSTGQGGGSRLGRSRGGRMDTEAETGSGAEMSGGRSFTLAPGIGGTVPQPFCPSPSSPSDYEERSHLQDIFAQMMLSLQEVAAAQGECLSYGIGSMPLDCVRAGGPPGVGQWSGGVRP